jgi:D-glycero-D-manno-heptose 1,7-bisphosphate phosphatase
MADASSFCRNNFHEDLGVWIQSGREKLSSPRGALFLDRDGVIIVEKEYLSEAAEVELIPGAAELIAAANELGVPVVEVTNQAGIGRGYFGWTEFEAIEAKVAEELAASGARLDAALACPYHDSGVPPWNHPDHPMRKPRPGMLLEAARRLNLDLGRSWIVGDKNVDLQAGWNAGLRGGLHVLTGHGAAHRPLVLDQLAPAPFELRLGESIHDARPLLALLASSAG